MYDAVFLIIQGKVATLKVVPIDSAVGKPPKRKPITQFSASARFRLLKLLNVIDWTLAGNPLFVTLTYPDEVEEPSYRIRTYHRLSFHRSAERLIGKKFGMIWRQEWERRKTGINKGKLRPHFHLLITGVDFIPHEKVRLMWRQVIGHTGPHLATDVREVTGIDGAARYVAKYIAKYTSLDIASYLETWWSIGRFWGVARRSLIPLSAERITELHDAQTVSDVIEIAKSRLKHPEFASSSGFSLLGADVCKNLEIYANGLAGN